MGEVADLLGAEHQQEGPDARPAEPRGPRRCLRGLIATCDVIVENFTPRVLDQIGLDFAAVQALRPDAIMVRMPGFGLDGPWRDNPAFAYVIEDASGLTWLTGYPDRNPYEPYSSATRTPACTRSTGCCSRWSTAAAPARACSSRRRWWTPRSTSPPSRSSSTPRTARCCSGPATADRPRRRRTSTAPPTSTSSAARQLGRDRGRHRRAVGRACARRSAGRQWAMDPGARRRRPAAETPRPHRRAPGRVVRGPQRRRDRRCLWAAGVPVAKVMQPHRQAELPQLAIPRLLRGGRPSGERRGAAQHAADAVLRADPTGSTAARAAARRAQPRGAGRARVDRRRDRRARSRRRHRPSARQHAQGCHTGWLVTPPVAGLVLERLVDAIESPAD